MSKFKKVRPLLSLYSKKSYFCWLKSYFVVYPNGFCTLSAYVENPTKVFFTLKVKINAIFNKELKAFSPFCITLIFRMCDFLHLCNFQVTLSTPYDVKLNF